MIRTDDALWICALNRSLRYKGGMARKLMDYFGSAKAVFDQSGDTLLHCSGLTEADVRTLKDPTTLPEAEAELAWALSKNIRLLTPDDDAYPYRLKECPDAPALLYVVGTADLNEGPMLAIVGTRTSTPEGKEMCLTLVEGLCRLGFHPTIVSGLAFGIDAAAHKAALACQLPTLAVLPNGVDEIYPTSHRSLAKEIVATGAVLSEFPSKTVGNRHNFLQRNRIIAGLADATLVVESKKDGGSLITAHLALGYGRDVLAVPGRPKDTCSQGCNRLIHENKAALVTSADEIADALRWERPAQNEGGTPSLFDSLASEEKQLLVAIQDGHDTINALCDHLRKPVSELAVLLTQLELRGIVRTLPDHRFTLPIDTASL